MTRQKEAQKYRLMVTCRTYWRDGAHPDPGVVTNVTQEDKFAQLRVWEVDELGFGEAIRRAEIRQRERLRRRAETAILRKYWTSPESDERNNALKQRKGK